MLVVKCHVASRFTCNEMYVWLLPNLTFGLYYLLIQVNFFNAFKTNTATVSQRDREKGRVVKKKESNQKIDCERQGALQRVCRTKKKLCLRWMSWETHQFCTHRSINYWTRARLNSKHILAVFAVHTDTGWWQSTLCKCAKKICLFVRKTTSAVEFGRSNVDHVFAFRIESTLDLFINTFSDSWPCSKPNVMLLPFVYVWSWQFERIAYWQPTCFCMTRSEETKEKWSNGSDRPILSTCSASVFVFMCHACFVCSSLLDNHRRMCPIANCDRDLQNDCFEQSRPKIAR